MRDQEKAIRDRKIYQYYWQCSSAKKVAAEMGISPEAVYRIWKRMRALDKSIPKSPCRCGEPKVGTQHYCRECLRILAKQRRAGMNDEQRKKDNCRSYTHLLVKRGKLKKQPCEKCSRYPVEAHHSDYNNPWLVRWLCRYHHVETHEEEKQIHQITPIFDLPKIE